MKWIKKGLLYAPAEDKAWRVSHAALPTVGPEDDGRRLLYYSSRDNKNRSQIGSLELGGGDAPRILGGGGEPVLDLGPLGAFDDNGVMPAWTVSRDEGTFLYYTGWTQGTTVPFYFYVGLAVLKRGGGGFRRVSPSPILERNEIDPFLTASPCVLIDNGLWRMWYVSGSRWEMSEGKPKHYYNIRYAESRDGIRWNRTGAVCIDYADATEYAIARPSVIKDGNLYRMWYCCRGDRYRIGYAESKDGISWERKDSEGGLDASLEGWDSEMAAYPCVFRHQGRWIMLYNGNQYGKTGFGYAVLENDSFL